MSSLTYGQVTLTDKVRLNAKDTSLKNVIESLNKQTELSFAFNPSTLPLEALVNYKADNEPLQTVLLYLSKKYHLKFEQIEKQIVLLPNPDVAPLSFKLNGTIVDQQTGEQMVGATIRVDGLNIGTITNGYGFYSLTLPYGTHTIGISYLGYQLQEDTIKLISNTNYDISLKQSAPKLQEIIVQGFRPPKVELIQTGKISISPKSVKNSPQAFGESDVIKSLERIPGIKPQSEGSTFFYVRGGNKDQNLILIDDAPIYNPSHLLGLYSTIVPESTKSIDVYKSDFPISKGGRLSSVIDIKTKEGNNTRFAGWGKIGLLSNQFGVEGPFSKGVSSYLLSGRFSHIKWLAKLQDPTVEKFNFYDLTGKVNFKLNVRNKIYFSFYTGSDKYLLTNGGLEWANFNGSARWNKIINQNTFMNTVLYGSNYEYTLHTNRETNEFWRSRIGEFGFKTDFTKFIHANQEFNWGINITGRTINPGNVGSKDTIPKELIVSVKNNVETAVYTQYQFSPNDKWGFKLGARAVLWTSMGEAFEFTFDDNSNAIDTTDYNPGEVYHNYLQIEPRISTSYFLSKISSIKASFDRTAQNLHLINNSISPFTSFEVWLPSGPNLSPQIANQLALGYYHYLPNWGLSLEIESYYKILQHQIDYKSHAATLLNPIIESDLAFGTTQTYGIEFFAKKDIGRVRGMIGYTLSKANSYFDKLNGGESFVANTDRPHYISANLNYDVSLRVTLSSNFVYSTGAPFSTPSGFYKFNGSEVPIYEQKNNSRLPSYHRLDVSAKFILNKKISNRFRHSLTVSIYNLYGRKNPIFINFNKSITGSGDIKVPSNLLTATRITSQRYIYGVAPSINYQFRF